MATSLATNLSLILKLVYTNPLSLSTPDDTMTLTVADSMANGVAADQCDIAWHDRRTATAAPDDLDVFDAAGGELFDPFGNDIAMAKVKGVCIHNRSTTAGETLTIGAVGGAEELMLFGLATSTYVLGPDGIFFIWEPCLAAHAAGAGNDHLRIDPGANTIIYDVVIYGTTA